MTTSQQTQSPALPLEEKTVADYLRDNPEFFQNNVSLLASLQIPHAISPAVSLVEYQVKVLRDQFLVIYFRRFFLYGKFLIQHGEPLIAFIGLHIWGV